METSKTKVGKAWTNVFIHDCYAPTHGSQRLIMPRKTLRLGGLEKDLGVAKDSGIKGGVRRR